MAAKIILASDEQVACPKCEHVFRLQDGITQKTIEEYESEYDGLLEADRHRLEEQLRKEAERTAAKASAEQLQQLTDRVQESERKAAEAQARALKAVDDAKAKAKEEGELERQQLAADLADKDSKIKEFRQQELQLRRDKQALEEAKEAQELELQRRLEDERTKIKNETINAEAERHRLREAEFEKQLSDVRGVNEELRRKLQQGSQQLQGEVLELELEHVLARGFPLDEIQEVKKGVRGADVLQCVRTTTGTACGRIIWEAKRAENWSDKWLQKLKDDQQDANAEIAVLVTTVLPKGAQPPFCRQGDIWIVSPHAVRALAESLRVVLLECHRLKLVNSGKNEKMELLYNYLASSQFTQRMRATVEAVDAMQKDLESEKRSMQKLWARRQVQIDRASSSMSSMCGELSAIAHDALPQLEAIKILSLAEQDDVT